jgi:hypothetical protein
MPDGFEIAKEDSGGKKPSWVLIVIIIAVIGAIVGGTIAFTRSRDTTAPLTLETVNSNVGLARADITVVKTEVVWLKEHLADLQADVDDLPNMSIIEDMRDMLSSFEDILAYLTGKVDSLESLLLSVNTTLTCCNCTCGGA